MVGIAVSVSFIVTWSGFGILPVQAATTSTAVPTSSKCLTADVLSTHAANVKQMEKDIAPYADMDEYQKAVQDYRDGMDVAWSAMLDPYCGFGAYGNKSAKKSYNKTVIRTRDAFLAQVKKPALPKVQVQTKVEQPPMVAPKIATQKTKTVVGVIPKNLRRGMRSAAVTMLQKKLVAHYGLPDDAAHVTGYFGPNTEKLVIKFQFEKKIITSQKDSWAGQVGPRTAAALNSL